MYQSHSTWSSAAAHCACVSGAERAGKCDAGEESIPALQQARVTPAVPAKDLSAQRPCQKYGKLWGYFILLIEDYSQPTSYQQSG